MQEKVEIGILNAYYGNLLNDKQIKIMHLYYDCDMSLAEVSEELGITRQGIRESLVRSKAKLIECEQKLKIVEKVRLITSNLENVIKELPDKDILEIKKDLEEILRSVKEI
ncbi:hypothetical protein EOM82_08935 [bacterium]|nr:hypothetical protein [bacterium]